MCSSDLAVPGRTGTAKALTTRLLPRSKLRDELLNAELFSTLYEAEVLIESWRRHYNAIRPHSSLGYRPPAPEAILPPARGLPYAPLRSARGLAKEAGL